MPAASGSNGTGFAPVAPGSSYTEFPDGRFSLELRLYHGYAQVADFDIPEVPLLAIDEPPPIGGGQGPNPARLLAASVGSCLASSLLFCLRKAKVEILGLRTVVEGTLQRNDRGRLRIGELRVKITPEVAEKDRSRISRCTELFEDFCIVTQSVREGIDVSVSVQA